MELRYKNFKLIRDQYCWTLIHLKPYDKLDKLGGVPTGEKGIKEDVLGYYPLNDFSIVLSRLAGELFEASTIEGYIEQYNKVVQDLKQFVINNVTNPENTNNQGQS
jgi:hypothetical protein